MKTYEITFFENAHKYTTNIKADSMVDAITFADIICGIAMGNIVSIKEVK